MHIGSTTVASPDLSSLTKNLQTQQTNVLGVIDRENTIYSEEMEETSKSIDGNRRNNTKFENLPENLIHHIMNFLSYEDAVMFSVLSKTFHSLWLSFPVLYFDYELFKPDEDPQYSFMSFILKTLHLRCPHHISKPLQRLSITYHDTFTRNFPFKVVFNALLTFAIENNCKEVVISLTFNLMIDVRSDSLLRLFSSHFLTVLQLSACRFPIAHPIILSPKLEELVISRCQGLQTVTVSSLSVKKVNISFCSGLEGVELKGKDLLHCYFDGLENKTDELMQCDIYSESIEDIHLLGVRVSKNLMELVTGNLYISKCDLPEHLSIQNPSIKLLKMRDNNELEKLFLLAPKLEMLSLMRCYKLREAIIDAPNLLEFDYEGSPEVYPMQILSTKFSTANIKLPQCNLDPLSWFGNMKQFLSCFDQIKDLTITCFQAKDLIFPREFVENNASPLRDLKHVRVQTLDIREGETLRKLVESSLWLVHKPLELTFLISGTGGVSTLKFKYGKNVQRMKVEERCCSGISTKCWRHYAPKVDIQGFTESERNNLNKLFDPYML